MKIITMNKTKGDKIASIVGDAWAIHKDERSILCAMIDELTKGTKWRKDGLTVIEGCYPKYFGNNNPNENKHCSYCKYFYCYNASMYCSHPTKCHKITAKRKNGCKYFEKI